MARIRDRFPGPAGGGFYSFLDSFTPQQKSRDELRELREAGLRRVYLGLESGHGPLLSWLDKPGTPGDGLAAAERAREAGLEVGLIVLVGAGGRRFAEPHLRDTLDAIRSLELGRDDVVFLSPFVDVEGSRYAARAERDGVLPLTPAEVDAQTNAFRKALKGRPHKVVLYDLRRWVY
jgi:radical SAM superfamily enzyme YgiQ (UPF0313 family)